MAQVAGATFGVGSIPFYVIQAATACVLLLAANTAFNGFPLLGSVLARDGYAPKALNTRGDRLVFSNGMIILGLAAILILIIFQANLTTLIQLYIIGVFVSFSLGQIGMVRHWRRMLRDLAKAEEVAASAIDTAAWTSLSTLPQDGPSAVASRATPGFTPISPQTIKRERSAAKVGLRDQLGRCDAHRLRPGDRDDHEVHPRRLPRVHHDPDPRDAHDRREPLLPRRRARDPGRRRDALRIRGRRRPHPGQPAAEAGAQGPRLRPRGHARQDPRHPRRGERRGVGGAPAAVAEARDPRAHS